MGPHVRSRPDDELKPILLCASVGLSWYPSYGPIGSKLTVREEVKVLHVVAMFDVLLVRVPCTVCHSAAPYLRWPCVHLDSHPVPSCSLCRPTSLAAQAFGLRRAVREATAETRILGPGWTCPRGSKSQGGSTILMAAARSRVTPQQSGVSICDIGRGRREWLQYGQDRGRPFFWTRVWSQSEAELKSCASLT